MTQIIKRASASIIFSLSGLLLGAQLVAPLIFVLIYIFLLASQRPQISPQLAELLLLFGRIELAVTIGLFSLYWKEVAFKPPLNPANERKAKQIAIAIMIPIWILLRVFYIELGYYILIILFNPIIL
jgi:hypothetical protein